MSNLQDLSSKMPPPSIEGTLNGLHTTMQQNRHTIANSTWRERRDKLQRLHDAVQQYRGEFQVAMHKDFRKNAVEVDSTEIFPTVSEIRFALKHLKSWMRSRSVPTPLALAGTSSWIKPEAKGVCLLIAPWNYPIFLALYPLVSAIAAGNCVIIKPSEMTPHTSAVLKKMLESIFPPSEIAVVEGDATVATALLKLKFDHIFFTGAPQIGKIVMRAAAENLTSVTLELGGKSPVIVDETANLDVAASRLIFAKTINCGQVCIAPDYILVHQNVKNAFIDALKKALKTQIGDSTTDRKEATLFARIVNRRHFDRIKNYLDDAISKGGKIEFGGNLDAAENYIEPTIVTDLPDNALLLQEEIFGPVLPIKTYSNLDEAIGYINAGEKPLALYIFSGNKKTIDTILNHTSAGGTLINDVLLHIANPNLPFGGVNHSGIGKGHGKYGFEEFSNLRGVMKQHFSRSLIELLHMPYNKWSKRLTNLMVKWL
ncbi:MAG: hypothetical protein RL757_1517 [Bacteroidota bacterium]|jgi:aldehyde dehydrogenase (NAD+)